MKILLNKKAGFNPAFTMIELVFVIVVLGILAGVAIPRLAATRDDATIVKAKSQISAIRSGIALQKSKRLLEGTTPFVPPVLDTATLDADGQKLFHFADGNSSNILDYAIISRKNADGYWYKDTNTTYILQLQPTNKVTFTYSPSNASFNCPASSDCNTLTQ